MWTGVLGGALLLVNAQQAVPGAPSARAPGIDSARSVVQRLVGEQHITGFAVTIAQHDSVLLREGFGFADIAAARPAASTTSFRIGSVSKLFTAVLLMRLVEEGVVSLDAPIGSYLDLPPALRGITLRQLSGHLGGIRHYRGNEFFTQTEYPSLRAALEVFLRDSLVAPPGSRYAYSSYGFNVIGAVLEAATRHTYLELLQRYVTIPLGLRGTAADSTTSASRARSYSVDSIGVVSEARRDNLSGRWPSGGLVASTDDMARLGRSVLDPGLLSASSLSAMFTAQTLTSGQRTTVGIGWRIDTDSAGRVYWHHGGTSNGGSAFLLVYPHERLVIAMASNAFTGWGRREALAVAEALLNARRLPH